MRGRTSRRTLVAAMLAALALALVPAVPADSAPPLLEPGALSPALTKARSCADTSYPECRRLKFFVGPIPVLPGTNAQYVLPITVQKPLYDGYMIRMRPDLIYPDGTKPPVDVIMLHHATWTQVPIQGNLGPFMASGEEKTIQQTPHGYGMRVKPSDVWALGYMIHSSVPNPATVYIEYDIDFVPKAAGDREGIKPVLPIWLDVGWNSGHPLYPVFNAQEGYGKINPDSGLRECAYPRDTCAGFDPYGKPQPGNGRGYDWTATNRLSGTLVGMGGHLHPGGIRDEVSVVRNDGGQEKVRRIFNSVADYYDPGGRISQDFSMTVTKDDWRVAIKPGDKIRLNAVYDTTKDSWYEPMGIVTAWLAPGDQSGVDPFATQPVKVKVKAARRATKGHRARKAVYQWQDQPVPIDLDGPVTHGHLPENGHYGGQFVRPLPTRTGPVTNEITISDFKYGQADLTDVGKTGIPEVREHSALTFFNADAALRIWHTITTCANPCTGVTGVGYPLANDTGADVDSLEIGPEPQLLGLNPTSGSLTYTLRPDKAGMKPGQVYTFFCRIHPFMRGAFKVVQ